MGLDESSCPPHGPPKGTGEATKMPKGLGGNRGEGSSLPAGKGGRWPESGHGFSVVVAAAMVTSWRASGTWGGFQ